MPDGPATPSNRADEETERFALPQALTYASVGAYIVGLLIVNLDLARHGIWDVELGRPQYILVGVLWAVLNGLALAWSAVGLMMVGVFFRDFHPKFRPWHHVPLVAWRLVLLLFFFAAAEALVFMVLVWSPLYMALGFQHVSGLILFSDFIQAVTAGFSALFLFTEASRHRNMHSLPVLGRVLQRMSEGPTRADSVWFVSLPLGILLLVMSISLYTYSLYPLLSKIIGGGRPPNVRLILDHPLHATWPSRIWVSPDGRRVGPVALLFESPTMVTVSPVEQPMTWYSTPGEPAPAVEINKSVVNMVLNEWRPYMDDVLVVGGRDAKGIITAQANFFSSSDGWRSGESFSNERGHMAGARAGFTATSIPADDSIFVLLAGGADQTSHARPTADSYQEYGSGSNRNVGFMPFDHNTMSVARMDHSATLLPDMDVLIAGGRNDTGPLASTELFHTGICCGGTFVHTFQPTGNMLTARFRHAATTLSPNSGPLGGRVLITGGIGLANQALREAEIYDPSSRAFASTGLMATAREGHTATLLNNGLILIVGGATAGVPLATAELFDPRAQAFHPASALHDARFDHTATLLDDGRVLISGGRGSKGVIGGVEIYDPQQNIFIQSSSMITPREQHAATWLNDGRVLFAGGLDAAGHAIAAAEIFDPWTESFGPAGVMPIALSGVHAVLLHKGVSSSGN
jgi:hypothetical protein